MFVALYRWHVKEGCEARFAAAWSAMTLLIRDTAGGLGSRLHVGEDGIHYAYAQWPSREDWEYSTMTGGNAESYRAQMQASAERIEPALLMDVVADHLVPAAPDG